jgi:predicted site-specific integrase-resolvase
MSEVLPVIVYRQTHEVARQLGVSEKLVRAMRKRGELRNVAVTTRGDALFTDEEIERAKERIACAAHGDSATRLSANG